MRINLFALALAMLVAESRGQPSASPIDPNVSEFPIVLTPTRLRQSIADVPASVTVITAATIRAYGITSVPDALRLVPGMAITQTLGNDYRINYHGSNILVPRRMNVLIDGISIYRPAFARVDWEEIPVAIEDIDRIEVTRSPNSAAYGANSMLAIVNIITKHPADVEGVTATTTFGSLDTLNATVRVAAPFGNTAVRLTANRKQDAGYDMLSRFPDPHDSTRLNRLNARSHTQVSDKSSLGLFGAFVEGVKEQPFIDAFQRTFPDRNIRDYYLGALWTTAFTPTHELQVRANYSNHRVRQEWMTCPPTATLLPELFELYAANPRYANTILAGRIPTGGTARDNALAAAALAAVRRLGARALLPTCTTPNQNLTESRSDLEVQDTFVFSDRLRIVAGLGAREERGTSATFVAGTVSNTSYRAFANLEYKPYQWLNLNAGGYFEDDQLTGSSFSPRIAANVHVSENQTVRVSLSKGVRVPDFFEQRANWTYTANDLNPPLNGSTNGRFYQSAVSPGNLEEERITSREIGYLLRIPRFGVLFDARAFDDSLSDLISEKLQLASFQPTNRNSARLRGMEFQATIAPLPNWSMFFVYGYLNNKDPSTELERTQYSKHSGAVGITQGFGNGWRWSLAYYGASGDGLGENYYGREDFTLSKTADFKSARITGSVIVRRLDKRSVTYFRDLNDILESSYDDRFQVFAYVRLSF
ncbi:MAG: TonB-dependent receptor [Burkholderiaceae bacterium]|nr:TonB-dependent receptor [Burkholderiaceae bacterium]